MKSLVGQYVFFAGNLLGRIARDEIKPVCWPSSPQRVQTLDNGHVLRDVTATDEKDWEIRDQAV